MEQKRKYTVDQLHRIIPILLFLNLIRNHELDDFARNATKKAPARRSYSENGDTLTHETSFHWTEPCSPMTLLFLARIIQQEKTIDIEMHYCGTRIGTTLRTKQPVEDEGCVIRLTTHAGRSSFLKNDLRASIFDLSMTIITPVERMSFQKRDPSNLIDPTTLAALVAFKNAVEEEIHVIRNSIGDMTGTSFAETIRQGEELDTLLPVYITDKLLLTNRKKNQARFFWG